jgi:hypothetical protein
MYTQSATLGGHEELETGYYYSYFDGLNTRRYFNRNIPSPLITIEMTQPIHQSINHEVSIISGLDHRDRLITSL